MTSFCNSRVRPLLAITKNSSPSILALALRQEGYGHLLYTCLWFRYRKDKDNSASVIYLKNNVTLSILLACLHLYKPIMQVLCVCISKKLIKWLEGNYYYHKLQIKQQHALLVHTLLNIKYISHKVIGGGTHQTPDDMILSQYFTHDTILLQFLTFGDKLSIAIVFQ